MNTSHGPVAGRLRRPGWRDPRLIVGIVLIVASIAGVSSLVSNADKTDPFFAARDVIPAGTVLTEDMVVRIDARLPAGSYVSAEANPFGLVVSRTIGQGELVPQSALAKPENFDGRPVAVRSDLPLSASVVAGAEVDVYLTVEGPAGPQARSIGEDLVVESVVRTEQQFGVSRGDTVYVIVPSDKIEDFLGAIATDGSISVVGRGAGS